MRQTHMFEPEVVPLWAIVRKAQLQIQHFTKAPGTELVRPYLVGFRADMDELTGLMIAILGGDPTLLKKAGVTALMARELAKRLAEAAKDLQNG